MDDATAGFARLRRAESTGRPIGNDDWIKKLETISRRTLAPKKRGPKRSAN